MSYSVDLPIEHLVVTSAQPYDRVIAALADRLGPALNWDALLGPLVAAQAPWDQVTQTLAAHIGASGLTLFFTIDHSALLALVGQTSRARQYAIGNPLLAVQMTQHRAEAALYAPLRLVVYTDEADQTFVAYDRFTTLIAQYQRADMQHVAAQVQQELEALVVAVTSGS